jgi:hypothetical protein
MAGDAFFPFLTVRIAKTQGYCNSAWRIDKEIELIIATKIKLQWYLHGTRHFKH